MSWMHMHFSRRSMMSKLVMTLILSLLLPTAAFAAKGRTMMMANTASQESSGRQEMLMDLSVHYVRDTKPDGESDSAARFSIGGMFNEWIGLDVQGLYQGRSKNYLVGADLRLVPNDWFFL